MEEKGGCEEEIGVGEPEGRLARVEAGEKKTVNCLGLGWKGGAITKEGGGIKG